MSNDRSARIYFDPARKFIVQRARRTKLLLQNCVPDAWKGGWKHPPPKTYNSRETQTSPVLDRRHSFDDSKSGPSTNSSLITAQPSISVHPRDAPSQSGDSVDSRELRSASHGELAVDWFPFLSKMGSCQCIHHSSCINGFSPCPGTLQESSLLEKVDELKHDILMIRSTLSSLQPPNLLDGQLYPKIPPPPPMPPPPVPPPQSLLLSVPQSSQLPLRRHESSLVVSNGVFSQDDGKPLITLEELQKVKLRKISSFSNNDKIQPTPSCRKFQDSDSDNHEANESQITQ